LQVENSGVASLTSETPSFEPDDDLTTEFDRLSAIESAALRQRAIWNAAAIWAASNPTDALDAIRAIPDTQAREEL
jgi:hypothetical protein